MEIAADAFRWVCHQIPERSFVCDGRVLLCSRCSGIYTGALAWCAAMWVMVGKLQMPATLPVGCLMLFLASLTPLEVMLEMFDFDGGNSLRCCVGALSGMGLTGLCHLKQLDHTTPTASGGATWALFAVAALFVVIGALAIAFTERAYLPPPVLAVLLAVGVLAIIGSILTVARRMFMQVRRRDFRSI